MVAPGLGGAAGRCLTGTVSVLQDEGVLEMAGGDRCTMM